MTSNAIMSLDLVIFPSICSLMMVMKFAVKLHNSVLCLCADRMISDHKHLTINTSPKSLGSVLAETITKTTTRNLVKINYMKV